MSKEITGVNSLIPRAFGYNYTVLHEDYVMILKISAIARYERSQKTDQDKRERDTRLAHAVAKAYISYSLETLANKAYGNTHSEEDLWTYISFPELERRLQGACKMRTLKDAMGELVEDGYVFKRPNRNPKYNTLEYRMNLEQYRREILSLPSKSKETSAKMHDLEEGTGADLHDEGTSANLHDAKMHDNQCKSAPTPSANLHAIINSNKQTDKLKEDTYRENVASANSHAPTPLSLEEMIAHLQANGYNISQGKQPELSTPVVETPVPNVENIHPTRQDDDQTEQASEQSYSLSAIQPATPEPSQSPGSSGADTPPSEKPARPPRQQKPKGEKPSLSTEEKNLQKEVQEWINSTRGYKLYGRAPKEQIFAERNATHALAHMLYLHTQDEQCDECCTWDDLNYTYAYCHDIDKYWSRPENKVRIGSYAVLQQFAPAMALKVQQPIDLDKARKDVHKQTALEHGSRPARAPMTADEIRKTSVWEGVK